MAIFRFLTVLGVLETQLWPVFMEIKRLRERKEDQECSIFFIQTHRKKKKSSLINYA